MDNDAKALLQLTGLKLQMVGEIGDPVVLGGFPKSGFNANVGAKAESSSTSVARNCRKRRSVFSFIKNGFAIPKGCDYYCITACNNSNPPGYVRLIGQGGFRGLAVLIEVTENDAMAAPFSRLTPTALKSHHCGIADCLWAGSGRRLGSIAERALICKWASTKRLAVAWRIILPIAETMRGGGE